MSLRFAVVVAINGTIGLAMLGGSASAGETGKVSTAGESPLRVCSEAAASSVKSGAPSSLGLAACDEAIKNSLVLTRSQRAGAYLDRSVLLTAAGDYEAAVADDTASLELQPDLTEAYLDRGAALMELKRFADAAADYGHALALGPQQPEAVYFDRALAREDLGDIKGAYADYREAARLNPSWDRPKAELARFAVAGIARG